MATDRIERAYQLFEAALARVPDERGSWLAGACAQDEELRREVLSLLEHDRRSGVDFLQPLEPPPGAALRRPPGSRLPLGPELPAGTRFGRCRITRLIGRGGMADVYEATQDDPQRVVALKVLRRDAASRSALRRFQFERQVLARMRHPNVAQIFDAGIHRLAPREEDSDGSLAHPPERRAVEREHNRESRGNERPADVENQAGDEAVAYFVMEYIPGARTIIEFAAETALDEGGRVELFVRVCDAVHHGHQKGIIHRDLKPANILVDLEGVPKVIDFGVARATDSDVAAATQQTDAGLLVGTLQYMSPEQCDADPNDVDTRSDVYSLGVVLYELLTGELPYDVTGTSIYHATRMIKEAAPRPLFVVQSSALHTGDSHRLTASGDAAARCSERHGARQGNAPAEAKQSFALRGRPARRDSRKLEAIVGMALAKDRERRYASAADLAADLRNFCAGEPIIARPPSAWERAIHWIGRHPLVVTTAACVGLALIVVFATWAAVWYINERPYSVRISPDRSFVHLRSLTGRILYEWNTGGADAIRFATFVPRSGGPAARSASGAARRASGSVVLGFEQCPNARVARAVCVFDADSPADEPLWSRRIEPGEPLPDPHGRGYEASRFSVSFGAVVDVFDEVPGPEAVVTHCVRPYTQTFLRIYALADGELLYQAWHDGALGALHWLPGPRLLVALGNNAAVPGERRGLKMGNIPHPNIVLAIRPALRFIAHDYLRTEPGDGPLDPAWYLYLSPAETADNARSWGVRESLVGDATSSFGLQISFSLGENVSLWWEIDASGREIPGSRVVTDNYKRRLAYPPADPRREGLPDPDALTLLPLPPIQAESTAP